MSRDIVQVVLRDSTSTSPDCSAVKRSLAVSGMNLTLVGSLKIAAAIARQIVDVEAGPVALVVGQAEAGEAGVDAALHEALLLDVVRAVCAEAAPGPRATTAPNAAAVSDFLHGEIAPTLNRLSPLWRSAPVSLAIIVTMAADLALLTSGLNFRQDGQARAPRPASSVDRPAPAFQNRPDAENNVKSRNVESMKKITPQDAARLGMHTKLVHAGRDPSEQHGFVNTPIYRGSTVLYPELRRHQAPPDAGTPTAPRARRPRRRSRRPGRELAGAAGTVLASIRACRHHGGAAVLPEGRRSPARDRLRLSADPHAAATAC